MVELLAPVGNEESLSAAIRAGADSVYFGIKGLNMRSLGAKNFEIPEIKRIVSLCHKNNVKAYLALNIIVYDEEEKKVDSILKEAKKAAIDAVIASDFLVIQKASSLGIPVHISTQCSVSSFESVKFYSRFADRAVLARELSLEQIERIKRRIIKENLKGPSGRLFELECFVHGAMCISVSGRCFMSLFEFNRSANRGECLQSCRRAYKIIDMEDSHELEVRNNYILSPKDICTIEILDKLIAAGIDSFKIEGRARAADYVFVVTKAYHDALDSIKNNSYTKSLKQKLLSRLKTVYNRGFSKGFYLGMPIGQWSGVYGSKATERKVYIGKVINYYPKISVAEVILETSPAKVGDEIAFTGPTTGFFRQKITELHLIHKPVTSAEKGCIVGIKLKEKVRKNDKCFVIKLLKQR